LKAIGAALARWGEKLRSCDSGGAFRLSSALTKELPEDPSPEAFSDPVRSLLLADLTRPTLAKGLLDYLQSPSGETLRFARGDPFPGTNVCGTTHTKSSASYRPQPRGSCARSWPVILWGIAHRRRSAPAGDLDVESSIDHREQQFGGVAFRQA